MPKQRRTFMAEFKKQMVGLYENGKSRAAIVEEYGLTASALDRWIAIGITTRYQQCAVSCKSPEGRSIMKPKKQPRKMTSPKPLWTSSTRIEKPMA
ncbi:transposase, partial [Paenibacillus popilliae]|uniref:transposase n=1 Tax=Paenibacillus popilliae TaxID=78057 RepID=UPI0011D24ACA